MRAYERVEWTKIIVESKGKYKKSSRNQAELKQNPIKIQVKATESATSSRNQTEITPKSSRIEFKILVNETDSRYSSHGIRRISYDFLIFFFLQSFLVRIYKKQLGSYAVLGGPGGS